MELYETLSLLVKENGPEVLESPELHQFDDVRKCLHGYPAIASVLSKAVVSGSIKRLIASGLWDDDTRRMVDKFVVHTGFQPALANYLFVTVAKSAGINVPEDNSEPTATDHIVNASTACEPRVQYGAPGGENPAWRNSLPTAGKNGFITSLIEVDREMESTLGVTLKYPLCTKTGEGEIILSMEISRTAPNATAALHVALYNMEDAIVLNGLAAALTLSSPARLPVMLRLPCIPSALKRILLYWQ